MILIVKHIREEGPGTLGDFFKNSDWEIETIEAFEKNTASSWGQWAGIFPENISQVEAVISLGGPMNVYEEEKYPFLKEEDIFLKKVLKAKIPFLGICLGVQILAKVCGAKIKNEEEEIGWYKVNLTQEGEADLFFEGVKKELDVFQWHKDTFELPEGAVLLASSAVCPLQSFCVGNNAYGIQFHVEVNEIMMNQWAGNYRDVSDLQAKLRGNQMLIDYYQNRKEFERQAQKLYLNFSRIIAKG